jgi:hypothetical protein
MNTDSNKIKVNKLALSPARNKKSKSVFRFPSVKNVFLENNNYTIGEQIG